MPLVEKYKKLKALATKYHQEHVFQFYHTLSEAEKEQLLNDLSTIHFEKLGKQFQKAQERHRDDQLLSDSSLSPIPSSNFFSRKTGDDQQIRKFEKLGFAALAHAEIGLLLLAGGQGTRLGTSQPKGMYDVGLPSGKTLYQLQAERLLKLKQLASAHFGSVPCRVPWYIMASESTQKETRDFLIRHNYFGLPPEDVVVFEQNTLPCLTPQGRILMETRCKVARAPDGNGGLYSALVDSDVLSDMKRRKIRYIHVYCVDNILVRVADPVFLGYCIDRQADCAAKVVSKRGPNEPVGIICLKDGKSGVVEYSEISDNVAYALNPDGSLRFNCGNIANHFFSLAFLAEMCRNHDSLLTHHFALKKIPTIDWKGDPCSPDAPNGIKLELFIFDVFAYCKQFAVLEVSRREEFSPLKNKKGAAKDCPETCRRHLMKLHQAFLRKAGANLVSSSGDPLPVSANLSVDDDPAENEQEFICEISPLVSYAGEGLQPLVQKNSASFRSPVILQ